VVRRGAFLAAGVLLVFPAAGQAAVDTIGSDLSGTATTAIQRTEDTALAQLTGPGGGQPTVPNSGQILDVKVKGCSSKDAAQNPETALFVQDLKPSGGGYKVETSSQRFHLPICGAGGDANHVSTFAPQDQCVARGDLVGIVVGGQTPGYPNGTRYLIAKPAGGAALGLLSGNGRTVTGSTYNFERQGDTELLMQARIGSAGDSPSRCAADPGGPTGGGGGGSGGGGGGSGGGGSGGGGGGTRVSASSLSMPRRVTADNGRISVPTTCHLASSETCRFSLVAGISNKGKTRVGSLAGAVGGGESKPLQLRLNKKGRSALSDKGKLSVVLRGTLRADSGRARITRKLTVSG
jgi:hypothetical protein